VKLDKKKKISRGKLILLDRGCVNTSRFGGLICKGGCQKLAGRERAAIILIERIRGNGERRGLSYFNFFLSCQQNFNWQFDTSTMSRKLSINFLFFISFSFLSEITNKDFSS